jgi:hypothetical protein
MNFKTFSDRFELIELNFNFKYNAKLLPLVYEQIKSMSDEEFNQGINRILLMTSEKWSEKYNYGKIPAIADWTELLSGKKKLTLNEIASAECEKIMYEARYGFSSHVFENETTRKVLSCFPRGIKTIHYDCFDSYNSSPKDKGWYKKDLVNKWLDLHNVKEIEFMRIDEKVKALPNIKLNK